MQATLERHSRQQLEKLEADLTQQLEQHRQSHLTLDLTRGKPGPEQLDLSNPLDGILQGRYHADNGDDLRNYGGIEGIPEARALFAEIMGVDQPEILVGGNSSLTTMYYCVLFALQQGVAGGGSAWRDEGQGSDIKFLAPCPGYDRHFAICQQLGIKLIPVAMLDDGPDMDQVEQWVAGDPLIKGIWCVPRFSNPTGTTYSPAVLKRLARLQSIAGANFRVFCDNAYAVHAWQDDAPAVANIMDTFKTEGSENSLYLFGSTSKMTFAGAGVSYVAMTEDNQRHFKQQLGIAQIGPDKINQLRHVKLLRDLAHVDALMKRHAALLKPRFDIVLKQLREGLEALDIAHWTEPKGGYFISFDTRPGLATTVVELAASVGVKLTPAGSTYPYGNDPHDSNIRIAPSFPALKDVGQAMSVFVVCVKLATIRQHLATMDPV
jgi:aspartate/methionine/tyrosine aminotransferase